MSTIKSGTIPGNSVAITIGLGIDTPPQKVLLTNTTSGVAIEYHENMPGTVFQEGIHISAAGVRSTLILGAGIAPYAGGDKVPAANTTYYIHGKDHPTLNPDKRKANVANGYAAITTWTRGAASDNKGHVNAEANTTYVGIGSKVIIKETVSGKKKTAYITGLTSNGEATDEIILSKDIKSGMIQFLGNMNDFVLAPAGYQMSAGLVVNEITDVNTDGNARLLLEYAWED